MDNKTSKLEIAPSGCDILIQNDKDGSILVLIPGGKFLAGGKEADEGGKVFEVELPAFYAGITAVTNAQYAQFLNSVRPDRRDLEKWILLDRDSSILSIQMDYKITDEKETHPIVQVSWLGAQAYCHWAGLRLPNELEWEKAARFIDGREYPWGDKWDQTFCHNGINRSEEPTSPVFSYPKGTCPWGLYQMTGNVWEWCQDWYDRHAYESHRAGKPVQSAKGNQRVVRGGGWDRGHRTRFRCAHRSSQNPNERYFNYSFRVFKDAP